MTGFLEDFFAVRAYMHLLAVVIQQGECLILLLELNHLNLWVHVSCSFLSCYSYYSYLLLNLTCHYSWVMLLLVLCLLLMLNEDMTDILVINQRLLYGWITISGSSINSNDNSRPRTLNQASVNHFDSISFTLMFLRHTVSLV